MAWWVVVFAIMICFESVFGWEIVLIVCCGCFLIDFTIDWWDRFSCLLCFVFRVLLIEWLRGLFFLIVWCNYVLVFCWTVVIFWERRKIKVWRGIAMLPLLNPMSKWVLWSMRLNFWFWWIMFVVKMLLCSERRFANNEKVNRLPNSDG